MDALNKQLAQTTTREFATNLLLDKIDPTMNKSLRQTLLEIPSSAYPGTSVFHTIDPAWREDKGVTFTFVPENESNGRMYVSSLIPYLRSVNPWFLSMFSEDARNRHRRNHWDPSTNQLFSTDESGMDENVYIDDKLNCSDEPTAAHPERTDFMNNPDIQVDIPDVEITGETPPVLRESDSVSTFRSKIGLSRSQKPNSPSVNFSATTPNSHSQGLTAKSTPVTMSATEDGSVSKLSDAASRLSAFKSKFNTVTDELTEALSNVKLQSEWQEHEFKAHRKLLMSILNALQHSPIHDPNQISLLPGDPSITTSVQANPLLQLNQTGGPEGAAGNDS
jgi:hypothetical protein